MSVNDPKTASCVQLTRKIVCKVTGNIRIVEQQLSRVKSKTGKVSLLPSNNGSPRFNNRRGSIMRYLHPNETFVTSENMN